MSRPKKPRITPPGKVWVRRRGNWVLIDEQVHRWRKQNARRAFKERVNTELCGRELDLGAQPADPRDVLDDKLFS